MELFTNPLILQVLGVFVVLTLCMLVRQYFTFKVNKNDILPITANGKTHSAEVILRAIRIDKKVNFAFEKDNKNCGEYVVATNTILMPLKAAKSKNWMQIATIFHEFGHSQDPKVKKMYSHTGIKKVYSHCVTGVLGAVAISAGNIAFIGFIAYFVLRTWPRMQSEIIASRLGLKAMEETFLLTKHMRRVIVRIYLYWFSTYLLNYLLLIAIYVFIIRLADSYLG